MKLVWTGYHRLQELFGENINKNINLVRKIQILIKVQEIATLGITALYLLKTIFN